jgi:hypothetical protein
LKMPVIDETTTDTTVQLVNLDGFLMTALVSCNVRGDADLIIDLNTGITFELMKVLPDVTEEDEKTRSILADKTELENLMNLPSARAGLGKPWRWGGWLWKWLGGSGFHRLVQSRRSGVGKPKRSRRGFSAANQTAAPKQQVVKGSADHAAKEQQAVASRSDLSRPDCRWNKKSHCLWKLGGNLRDARQI